MKTLLLVYSHLLLTLILLSSCDSQRKKIENSPEEIAIPEEMVLVEGGTFVMGSSEAYAESDEGPEIQVQVRSFLMDKTEVTNAQFALFVEKTGYITVAEKAVSWELLKKELPARTPKPHDSLLAAGALVFMPPAYEVPLHDYSFWWKWVRGADWKHPKGPESNIEGKEDHPVVQIAYEDAVAYAKWKGKRLPTEAEWEYAACGGGNKSQFMWGHELTPNGEYLANFFQGKFPYENWGKDGFMGAAPVKSYPPNAYGLYDMIGNVWEWTQDLYRVDTKKQYTKQGITICKNPKGPATSYDPNDPYASEKRVVKGGSFLCSEQYCSNYRPTSRIATSHDS